MKIQKRKIIYLLIFLIICIIVLLVQLVKISSNKTVIQDDNEILEKKDEVGADIIENTHSIARTSNIKSFYTVNECIRSYFMMIKANDSEVIQTYLNEEYIEKEKITNSNIFNIIDKYKNYDTYRTVEMYQISKSQLEIYYVRGRIDKQNVYFKVRLDTDKKDFDLEQLTEEVYTQMIDGKEGIENNQNPINNKIYNSFVYKELTDELIAKAYFTDYIKAMITDTEEAYKMLDKQYSARKFTSFDDFDAYVKNNNERLNNSYKIETSQEDSYKNFEEYYNVIQKLRDFGVKSYAVEYEENSTRYICVDGYNNYFMFNITSPGVYTVMLDTYTLDTEEFLKKYNSSDNKTKVGINIERVIQALNSRDYKYIYSRLDETFKNNNFKTQKLFEDTVKKQFYNYNIISVDDIKDETGYYIANITLKDNNSDKCNSKKLTIIMQLKEETEFIMSFSLN